VYGLNTFKNIISISQSNFYFRYRRDFGIKCADTCDWDSKHDSERDTGRFFRVYSETLYHALDIKLYNNGNDRPFFSTSIKLKVGHSAFEN